MPIYKKIKPKLYRVNDCDVVIATSKKRAEDWYANESGCDALEVEAVGVRYGTKHWWIMRNEEQIREVIRHCGPVKIGFFNGDLAVFISYKQSMEMFTYNGPEIFSSSEW